MWGTIGNKWDEVGDKEKTVMLIGEFEHKLDDKKRLALPSKFRKELGSTIVLTRGLDHCVFVYPLPQWQTISEKVSDLPLGQADSRGFTRFLLSGAVDVSVDKSGRILIPDVLKEFGKLESKVVVAGVGNRLEIWNSDLWGDYKKKIETEADVLAEKLGDIGMI